jgi:uncharacterized protein (DUF983 family)
MGRLAQKGLGYFSLDTNWETSVKLVKAKYGALEGIGFLAELWASIYRENYYRTWNEETELLFADEIKKPIEWVHEVIEYCFEKGIFDRVVYNAHSVLTSHGIQKRYFKIARDSLGRNYIDYIEGITYPDFMPENIVQGNPDKVLPKPDKVEPYPDKVQGKCNKAKQSKAIEFKELAAEQAAAVDNFLKTATEADLAELYAFALALMKTRRGMGNATSATKKHYRDPDIVAAFLESKPKPATPLAPEPGPCPSCGGELNVDRVEGEAVCRDCGIGLTYSKGEDRWNTDENPGSELAPLGTCPSCGGDVIRPAGWPATERKCQSCGLAYAYDEWDGWRAKVPTEVAGGDFDNSG